MDPAPTFQAKKPPANIEVKQTWLTFNAPSDTTVPRPTYLQSTQEREMSNGTIIDNRYKVNRSLHHFNGAYASACSIVKHTETGTIYFCKCLQSGTGKTEAEKLAKVVGHPHITSIVEYTSSKMSDRIYQDFCDRGTLKDVIQRYAYCADPVPERFVWTVFEALAKAVLHCHTRKRDVDEDDIEDWNSIIHRDITPANVFLTHINNPSSLYPRPVLGDFGSATTQSELDALSELPNIDIKLYTPEGKRHNVTSDVFQVGLVIWCLTYRVLDRPDDEMLEIQDEEMRRGTWKYSRELRRVIHSCLYKRTEDRVNAEGLLRKIKEVKEFREMLPREALIP